MYKTKAHDSIMWEYFRVGFNDFMLKGKSLWEYTTLVSSNDYGKKEKIIPK